MDGSTVAGGVADVSIALARNERQTGGGEGGVVSSGLLAPTSRLCDSRSGRQMARRGALRTSGAHKNKQRNNNKRQVGGGGRRAWATGAIACAGLGGAVFGDDIRDWRVDIILSGARGEE
jgi:hypothetical protein